MKPILLLSGLLLVASGSPAPGAGGPRITVLYENLQVDDRFRTGWGFAILLEYRDHTVLFDTGADGDAPSHCTGDRPLDLFRVEYGDHFIESGAGRLIDEDDL